MGAEMPTVSLRSALLDHLSPHTWKTGQQLRREILRRTITQGRLGFWSRALNVPSLYVELFKLEEEKLIICREELSEGAEGRREYLLTTHGVKKRIELLETHTNTNRSTIPT